MGGKAKTPSAGKSLLRTGAKFAQEAHDQTLGTRTIGNQQAEEFLKTGGINANLPAVTQAMESVRNSNALGRQNLSEGLATAGLEGSPYALGAYGAFDTTAGLAENTARSDATNKYLGQLAQMLNLGPVQAAPFMGGTSAAIASGSQGTDYSGLYAGLGSVVGSVAAAKYGNGGGTTINYGTDNGGGGSSAPSGSGGGGRWGW